jgi:hypothetical protein
MDFIIENGCTYYAESGCKVDKIDHSFLRNIKQLGLLGSAILRLPNTMAILVILAVFTLPIVFFDCHYNAF